MSKRNYIFFIYSMQVGGAEKFALDLMNFLSENGSKVKLILMYKKGELLEQIDDSIELIEIRNFYKVFAKFGKYLFSLSFIYGFFSIIRKHQNWNIISVAEWPNLISGLTKLIFKIDNKLIITEHSTRVFLNAPSEYNLNNIFKYLSHLSYLKSDSIIVSSNSVFENVFLNSKRMHNKIRILNNPINIDKINILMQEKVSHPFFNDSKIPILVSLGRLEPIKDHLNLLNAFKIAKTIRPMKLLIIGNGSMLSQLKEYTQNNDLNSDVDFLGTQLNPYKYLFNSNLLVHSSIYEGFGNVFIEALACGLPIVTTDCNTPKEILDNDSAIIVDIGNTKQFSDAIISSLNQQYDRSMLQLKSTKFDVRNYYIKFNDILNENPNP